jgi:AraC-like DNA-binding protein
MGIAVVDFLCQAGVEPEGAEEANTTHGIVFVRRGVFRRMRAGEVLLADPNQLLFFNAAEPARIGHPVPGGDECTILEVETPRALELVASHAPRDAEDPDRPFRRGHTAGPVRVSRLHYELLSLLRRGERGLPVEDTLSELADEAVRALCGSSAAAGARFRSPASARRGRDLVEATKVSLNESFASPPDLAELARSAGCSPFHLSRTFRRIEGVSLRRYAKRLRARLAAHHLVGRQRDLTGLALELGYADHSHFTNAFREEWGVPPSRFRGGTGRH